MDKGAHYYCCDFQVHSPRDLRWVGKPAITLEERKLYASSLIASCREKKLGAIAVTDHHDLLFAKFIRAAAQEELDENGDSIPESDKIIIFPGMELTLSEPCQALLLFDANLPDDMFSLIGNALALNTSSDSSSRTSQVERLDLSLNQIKEALDRHDYLKGRFILFPNVSETGSSTILRSGFAKHYISMPCFGGYLDGSISQLGKGNSLIIQGKNKEYGYKKIGVFQTSDNRREDHNDLGVHSTWVKWAQPSAEALRQACLADKSRLSHVHPDVPQIFITDISLSNSKFLGPLNLNFNRQFNAVIGGRGTGKSSILEYLRWAVCDEPIPEDSDESINYETKRKKLIEKTLIDLNAVIQVSFIKNDVLHTLRRYSTDGSLLLKIGSSDFEAASESQVRTLLPIQAYSQKQLSSVGVRIDQLRRFIEVPLREQLTNLQRLSDQVKQELRQEHARRERYKLLFSSRLKLLREAESIKTQASTIRAKLVGLSDEDQITINLKASIDEEKILVASWKQELQNLRQIIDRSKSDFLNRPRRSINIATSKINLINPIHSELRNKYSQVAELLNQAENILSDENSGNTQVPAIFNQIDIYHSEYDIKYSSARDHSSSQQSTLKQLSDVDENLKNTNFEITQIDAELESLTDANKLFLSLVERWFDLNSEKSQHLVEQCTNLTTLSGGMIKAKLQVNVDFEAHIAYFQKMVRGASIRISKIEELFQYISSSSNVLQKWREVLRELENIVVIEGETFNKNIGDFPILKGFLSQIDIQKLSAKMTSQDWIELVLSKMESLPTFEYRARENDYIAFEDASAGQQATALLWALLNQDGPPLVIDQPEDDLDSQIINRIVEQLWAAKGRRQIIFSSHNANLVVNGDAELVICCDYRKAGEQSSGHIKFEGAIDIPEVRNEITQVMEGGIEAFKLRKEKYGF